mmetsp:Transcript_6634/g.28288  ORF Transcript_6634/g.28288 Transcript_6634/m.28288 type:complete len:1062 (-) Transcript_6634:2177-5362(-)
MSNGDRSVENVAWGLGSMNIAENGGNENPADPMALNVAASLLYRGGAVEEDGPLTRSNSAPPTLFDAMEDFHSEDHDHKGIESVLENAFDSEIDPQHRVHRPALFEDYGFGPKGRAPSPPLHGTGVPSQLGSAKPTSYLMASKKNLASSTGAPSPKQSPRMVPKAPQPAVGTPAAPERDNWNTRIGDVPEASVGSGVSPWSKAGVDRLNPGYEFQPSPPTTNTVPALETQPAGASSPRLPHMHTFDVPNDDNESTGGIWGPMGGGPSSPAISSSPHLAPAKRTQSLRHIASPASPILPPRNRAPSPISSQMFVPGQASGQGNIGSSQQVPLSFAEHIQQKHQQQQHQHQQPPHKVHQPQPRAFQQAQQSHKLQQPQPRTLQQQQQQQIRQRQPSPVQLQPRVPGSMPAVGSVPSPSPSPPPAPAGTPQPNGAAQYLDPPNMGATDLNMFSSSGMAPPVMPYQAENDFSKLGEYYADGGAAGPGVQAAVAQQAQRGMFLGSDMSLLGGGGGLPGSAGGSSQFALGTNSSAGNNMLFPGGVLGGPNAPNVGAMDEGSSADLKNISLQMQMAALINVQQMYAAQMAQMASIANPSNPNLNPAAINGAFPGMKNPLSMPQMQEYDERELEGMGDRRGLHGSPGIQGLDRQRKKMGEPPVGSPINRRLQRGRRGGRQDEYLGYGDRRASNVGIIGVPETIQSRSPLLETFRATSASVGRSAGASDAGSGMLPMNSGIGPREWHLGELKGHVVEFATDQHGSRFIQQQLEVASQEEVQIVLTETLEDVQILMMDVFGNYVVQKLLEYGGKQAVQLIAAELSGRMLTLSLHMYGCRVVQKVLEVLDNNSRGSLVRELDSHILKCIHDQNGNHVIQKCVQLVDPAGMQFIVDAVIAQAVTLAEHSYGCRVVQRILEHGTQEQKEPIMKEIMRNIEHLINDQYGNYVIQHVVEHGTQYERDVIIDIARKNIYVLSQHKFASNVVERCLQHGSIEQRRELIEMFIVGPEGPPNPSPLGSLVRDQYGNYVVQRILDIAEPGQRMRVVEILRDQVSAIKKYSYGKHIVARLEH